MCHTDNPTLNHTLSVHPGIRIPVTCQKFGLTLSQSDFDDLETKMRRITAAEWYSFLLSSNQHKPHNKDG